MKHKTKAGPRPAACVVLGLCFSLVGTAQEPRPGAQDVELVVQRLDREREQAVRAAVEAIAGGVGGEEGRRAITQAIAARGLERHFAQSIGEALQAEIDASMHLNQWKTKADPLELPVRLPRIDAVRSLLRACLDLRASERTVRLTSNTVALLYTHFPDQETAVLVARVVCSNPHPESLFQACLATIKAGFLAERRRSASKWEPVIRIALRSLADLPGKPGEVQGTLDWCASSEFPLAVRMEALAALRGISPETAIKRAAELTKEKLPDDAVAELERLLIDGEPPEVRREAALLVHSIGRTADVRRSLWRRLAQDSVSGSEHAQLMFALRLLEERKP